MIDPHSDCWAEVDRLKKSVEAYAERLDCELKEKFKLQALCVEMREALDNCAKRPHDLLLYDYSPICFELVAKADAFLGKAKPEGEKV